MLGALCYIRIYGFTDSDLTIHPILFRYEEPNLTPVEALDDDSSEDSDEGHARPFSYETLLMRISWSSEPLLSYDHGIAFSVIDGKLYSSVYLEVEEIQN